MEKPPTRAWLKDLDSYLSSIPFGEVQVGVKRVDRKTVEITTVAEETLRYVNNDEALRDLERLVVNLVESKYSGDATVRLQLKDGQIQILGIYNKKKTNY